jgi:hypothetical protein
VGISLWLIRARLSDVPGSAVRRGAQGDNSPTLTWVALTDEILATMALEGVPSAVAAARDGIDALLRDRGLRRTSPGLTAESLLRGAAASAQLEGSGTDLDQLRRGEADTVASSAARLNAGLLALVPVVTRSPLQALARMHTLAAAGSVAQHQLGRPRAGDGAAQRLQALAAALLAPAGVPAVSLAAVAHAEVAAYQPFDGGNGLVARALERLILVARGVDPASILVPEAGHLAMSAGYRSALAAYAGGTARGRRQWLLHCAQALTLGAELSPLHYPRPRG